MTGRQAVILTVVTSDEAALAQVLERLSRVASGFVLEGYGVNLNAGQLVDGAQEGGTPP